MLSTRFSTSVENLAPVECAFRVKGQVIHINHQIIHRFCGSLRRDIGGFKSRKTLFSWAFDVSTGFAASLS